MKISIELSGLPKGIHGLAIGARWIAPPDAAAGRYFTASASSISFCPFGTPLANSA
jgi:hypothetical protein